MEGLSPHPPHQRFKRPVPTVQGQVEKFVPVQLEKCASCQKTVYATVKLEVNKAVYHRTCFKCSHCRNRPNPGNYSVNQGIVFCTNHYKQLFARKGNYDEGFGREQYKKNWQSEPNQHAALA